MSTQLADQDDLVGRVLGGRYHVQSRLNGGGMGVLFEALDTRAGKPVAIKLLAAEFAASAEVLARFELEAHALERVRHPNVVTLRDASFELGEDAYLVLELLEGESLGDFLHRRGALAAAEAVRLVSQIAEGLMAAHREGIVHRDLKPDNIMLTGGLEQQVKLLDFGICKVKGRPLTREQIILGTPDYMAPEQARGQLEITAAADQFALGVLAFEMLSGRVPFDAEDPMQVLYQIVHERAPDITDFAHWIPMEANDVVQRALNKDPSQRYSSVLEFAAALRDTLDVSAAAFDEEERSSHARLRVLPPDVRRELPTPCVAPPPSGVARTERCPPPVFGERERLLSSLHLLEDLFSSGEEAAVGLSSELCGWLEALPRFLEELAQACFGLEGCIEYSAPLLRAESAEHAYLLSRLERGMTLEEAIDVSGLPRGRALRVLVELCEKGAVRFAAPSPGA